MSEYSFPKDKRLLCRLDYQTVYRQASRLGSRNLLLLIKPNDKGYARLGLSFTRKRVRKAVSRNTLKRLSRETFRLAQSNLPAVDVVVLASEKIDQVDKTMVQKCLEKLWQQLPQHCNGLL